MRVHIGKIKIAVTVILLLILFSLILTSIWLSKRKVSNTQVFDAVAGDVVSTSLAATQMMVEVESNTYVLVDDYNEVGNYGTYSILRRDSKKYFFSSYEGVYKLREHTSYKVVTKENPKYNGYTLYGEYSINLGSVLELPSSHLYDWYKFDFVEFLDYSDYTKGTLKIKFKLPGRFVLYSSDELGMKVIINVSEETMGSDI